MSSDPTQDATLAGASETSDGPRAAASTSQRALVEGDRVGSYTVVRRIGRGGMGVVYEAHDPRLDRTVALKILRAAEDERRNERLRQRLLREAQAIARLSHPNVVEVLDAGTHEGRVYLAMELIDGPTLGEWLETPKDWREVLSMMAGVGRGVMAIHQAGLVHRDLKPDNVMIGPDGRPRVMDLGLVRADESHESSSSAAEQGRLAVGLTDDKGLVGTVGYIPPEAYGGKKAGPRGDQFSYCAVVFEALAGERPHAGAKPMEIAAAIVDGEIRSAPSGSMPRAIEAALRRGMSVAPGERWPDMRALLEALEQGLVPPRRWPKWVGALVAAVGGVSLGLFALTRDTGPTAEVSDEGADATDSGEPARESPALRATKRRVQEARDLVAAGKLVEATTMLEALLEHEDTRQTRAGEALVRLEIGKAGCRMQRLETCTRELERAFNIATELDEPLLAFNAALPLVRAAAMAEKADDARRWLGLASSRAADDDVSRLRLARVEARVLMLEGRNDEAVDLLEEVFDSIEMDDEIRGLLEYNAGEAALRAGRGEEAFRYASRSLERLEKIYGRDHMNVGAPLDLLAKAAASTNRAQVASAAQARLTELMDQRLSDFDTSPIRPFLVQARAAEAAGDFEAQRAAAAAGLELAADSGSPRSSFLRELAVLEVTALLALGRTQEAVESAARYLTDVEEQFPGAATELAEPHLLLADALLASGEIEPAMRHYESAVELARLRGRGFLATALQRQGAALLVAERYEAALETIVASLEEPAGAHGVDEPTQLGALATAVSALAALDRRDELEPWLARLRAAFMQWAAAPDEVPIRVDAAVGTVAELRRDVGPDRVRGLLEDARGRLLIATERHDAALEAVEAALASLETTSGSKTTPP